MKAGCTGSDGEQPLVSVIMPLYNKRPYVRRAVESVLAQSYPHWELIVVDDGSTDGSVEELPLDDPRISLVRQPNSGPAAARNRGITSANGDLVTFIDADDYYYPHKIRTQANIFLENPSARWLISSFDQEVNRTVRVRPVHNRDGTFRCEDQFFCGDALTELSVAGVHINGFCGRREMLLRTGGFDERMRYNEITEFMVRCALAEPAVMVCQRPLHRVVDVPESASKINAHVVEGHRLIGERLLSMSLEHPHAADKLSAWACASLYSYVVTLLLTGRAAEARKYLSRNCPPGMGARRWKLWLGCLLPTGLLLRFVRMRRGEA